MNTVIVPVKGLNFAGCGREIEKRLGKLAPILAVEASYVSQTVTASTSSGCHTTHPEG